MGPAIDELFRDEGALVTSVKGRVPGTASDFERYIDDNASDCKDADIVIANLAHDPCSTPVGEIRDEDWTNLFDTMVHPLMQIIRYFGPRMAERERGKIVAITSAAPLRGIPGSSAYCAARGAQNAFIRASGLELARSNVQVNAIAQNYVRNPAYYPDELVESERFRKHLERNVPLGRVAEPNETAELALFLASANSNFIVGQVVPFAGGWATNA
ncbi:MAG: SDR family oxidoreductase [Pseudomonadales bacterium]|nr:SDR family oxidoreductase [Pseudomonadales bacterium]